MKYIIPLTDSLTEDANERLSQFVLDNLRDLKSKLHYYDGNFKFLKSVQEQYKRKGYLTDSQWQAVYRCFYK